MKNVVVIGGGTGSFTVLKGLKNYPIKLSAIVSMSDNGGSTGRLRDELGVLPTGDIRQCLVALSDSSDKMRELMNYRFEDGSLKGHSFGNLLLSALEKINGNFSQGLNEAMEILKVRGEVIPVTTDNITLNAEFENGDLVKGESEIDETYNLGNIKRIFYNGDVSTNPLAIKRILEADSIIIGPGSHYTSIMSNLIIPGLSEAIKQSKAKVVYISNLTNKKNQTLGFDVDDYVNIIESFIGKDRINYILYNKVLPSKELMDKYIDQEGEGAVVEFNLLKNSNRKYHIVMSDLINSQIVSLDLSDPIAKTRSLIRHDSNKLSKEIMNLVDLKIWIFDLDDVLYNKSKILGDSYSNLNAIVPFPDTIQTLKDLTGVKILVTKSSSNKDIQNKKIDLLNIRNLFDNIIIVKEDLGKKLAFESILLNYNVSNRKDIVIVGDRIDSEIRYGNLLGCKTVLFNFGEGKYSHLKPKDAFEIPDLVISSLSELI